MLGHNSCANVFTFNSTLLNHILFASASVGFAYQMVCVFSFGSFYASIFAHHVTPSWPANTMTTTNALLMATHYHRTKSIYVENMQYRKILLRLPTFIDCLRKLDRFFSFHFLTCLLIFFLSLSILIRRFCRIKDGQNQTEIKLNAILFRVTACH